MEAGVILWVNWTVKPEYLKSSAHAQESIGIEHFCDEMTSCKITDYWGNVIEKCPYVDFCLKESKL